MPVEARRIRFFGAGVTGVSESPGMHVVGQTQNILQEQCMPLIAEPTSKLLILIFSIYLWWTWPKTILSLNALMTIFLNHKLLLSLFYNNNKTAKLFTF